MRTERCRSCGSTLLEPVLDLGVQPASDHFPPLDDPLPDPAWPLSLVACRECTLVQLGWTAAAPPEAPLAVESATMRDHAWTAARRVVAELSLGPGSTVAEFRSHHGGSWLPGLTSCGLEPRDSGPVDLVVDVHGLAHDEDLAAALSARAERVGDGGVLVVEFHHLLPLVEQCQYDTVRHGHPLYLSLSSGRQALAAVGLQVLGARREAVFGGSLLLTASRGGSPDATVPALLDVERRAGLADPAVLRSLQQRAADAAEGLRDWLIRAQQQGRRVVGYGAPSKAVGLLALSRVGPALLPYTADLSPAKHGRRIPGAGVPIVSPEHLVADRPDEVLLLAWDLADEIRRQLSVLAESGTRFVLPLPYPRYLD